MARASLDIAPLLDALRGLGWPARRPASRGGMAGTHRSRMAGVSPEFTEYRPYRQGDDPRRLDWKLLARTDRAFLRITSERATLGTVVVLDGSGSMAFPERGLDKWVAACRLAIGLAAVAHAAGDPVGLVVAAGSAVRATPPRTRRGVIAQLAALLEDAMPAGTPSLAEALPLAGRVPRLAIVSDFLGADGDALLRMVRARAGAGDDVHAVHVVAREELDPSSAAMLATDPEDAAIARPLVAETRDEYLAAFATWREGLARAWRESGAAYHVVRTDEDVARAVRAIAQGAAAAERRA